MDKTLRFSNDYENHPTFKALNQWGIKPPKSHEKFVVPWQLEEFTFLQKMGFLKSFKSSASIGEKD